MSRIRRLAASGVIGVFLAFALGAGSILLQIIRCRGCCFGVALARMAPGLP